MYSLLLSALCLLVGCVPISEPLVFHDQHPPLYVESLNMSKADHDQLASVLREKGFKVVDQHDFNGYKLVIHALDHRSRELYDDPASYTLFEKIHSLLDVSLYDRQKDELLWHRDFKTTKAYKPTVHFYSNQEWEKAGLIWQQQLQLFNKLSDDIKKTCKKESQASGS